MTSIRGDKVFGIGGARRCDLCLVLSVVLGDRVFLRRPSFGCPSDPNDMASVLSKSVKSIVSEDSLVEFNGVVGRIIFDHEASVLNISLTWGGVIVITVTTTTVPFACCFRNTTAVGPNSEK